MYLNVLAKKASAAGSDVVLSLCKSVVINSIKPSIAETLISEFPFSKKYRYLRLPIKGSVFRSINSKSKKWKEDQEWKYLLVQYFDEERNGSAATSCCIGHLLSSICDSQSTFQAKQHPIKGKSTKSMKNQPSNGFSH